MSAAIRIEYIFWLVAALLAICALKNLAERRWAMAAFWGVIACPFAFGEPLRAARAHGGVHGCAARCCGTATPLTQRAIGLVVGSSGRRTIERLCGSS